MPRPNFYMSNKDKQAILSLITNYLSMWDDADEEYMNNEELKEILRIRNKIKDMDKTKGFKNAIVEDALETANRVLKEKALKQNYKDDI